MNKPPKKILLINSHFNIGGIETALVGMANELCGSYQVDLLIYNPEGAMRERLDSRVNILKPSFALRSMGMTASQALKCKNPLVFLFKVLGSVWSHAFDNRLPIYIATKIQPKLKGYDLAIAYRQEAYKSEIASGFVRVLDCCVEAKRKIACIHYDATQFKEHQKFNEKYYKKIDKIIGVSKSVAKAYEKNNPSLCGKMDYCYNFIDYDMLARKSCEEPSVKYDSDKFVCFSACRFGKEKGIVRAINAIAPVLKEHKDVMWYIAGDGPERKSIESAIEEAGLQDRIILLGNLSNPYPYMKNSDLVMLLSYHEAAPMVYMEAKALHVPIFSTNTLSAYEMLKDGEEDFICENSEEGIRAKFKELIENQDRVVNAKEKLKTYQGNNAESLQKIEEWLA